jgi:hypothetical protein
MPVNEKKLKVTREDGKFSNGEDDSDDGTG